MRQVALSLTLAAIVGCTPVEDAPPTPSATETSSLLRVEVTPKLSAVPLDGRLQMTAAVFNERNEMVFSQRGLPIIVNWRSSNETVATVDEMGLVQVIGDGPVSITAEVDEDSVRTYTQQHFFRRWWRERRERRNNDEEPDLSAPDVDGPIEPDDPDAPPPDAPEVLPEEPPEEFPEDFPVEEVPLPEVPPSDDAELNPDGVPEFFTDVHQIFVSPTRIATDIGQSVRLEVSAIDAAGAPTTLDCGDGPTLTVDEDAVQATYDATQGAEGINLTGAAKGFSILTLECGGFFATPVVVEVKPSVTIPDPSPSAAGSDFGQSPSMATRGDEIHLATYDATAGKLVYTRFDGVWSSEFIDGEGDYGRHSQIVLDSLNNNKPMICALEGTSLACWLVDDEGYWARRFIDDVMTAETYDTPLSAAIGDDGFAHLLFHRQADDALVLATSEAARRDDWTLDVLTHGADHASMALASDGSVRVAFRQTIGGVTAARYGHRACARDDDEWLFEDIDAQDVSTGEEVATAGTFIKLRLGAEDRPQVVYFKGGNLVHAIKSAGDWRSSVIESVALGGPQLGFDLDGNMQARVSYYDSAAGLLRYASRRNGTWHIDSPASRSGVGSQSTLAVDRFNRVQIAYYDDQASEAGFYVEPHYLDYRGYDEGAPDVDNSLVNVCLAR